MKYRNTVMDPVIEAVVYSMMRGKLALDTTPLAPVAVTTILYAILFGTYGTLSVHPVLSGFISSVPEGPPEVAQITTGPALAFV